MADLAAALLAVDPAGLGGAVLRGGDYDASIAWARALHALLPAAAPWRVLPPNVSEDRLVGGIDLLAALGGARTAQRGLVADAHGGVLVLPSAERASAMTVGVLASALDTGAVCVERESVGVRHRARILTCTWTSDPAREVPTSLADRLAIVVDVRRTHDVSVTRDDVTAARQRLGRVAPAPDAAESLVAAAATFGIDDLRAPILALRVARAAAALHGRDSIDDDDLLLAAQLVLAPRARIAPAPPEAPEPDAHESPPDARADDVERSQEPERTLEERVVEAMRAALPDGLLDAATSQARGARDAARGSGTEHAGAQHGRPLPSRPGAPRDGQRVDVLATLRAAAPWQAVRRRGDDSARGVRVERADLHVRRAQQQLGATTLFVVDASGSMAARRLGEAKGAVQVLLAESYARRDRVALLVCSGRGVALPLPPTRALARARRLLAGLAGGGGTPLASALDAATRVVERERADGRTVRLVVLTDGRANVARDGRGDRARARDESLAAARTLARAGATSVVVDTVPRGGPDARELAAALGARHVVLPAVTARAIGDAVRAS